MPEEILDILKKKQGYATAEELCRNGRLSRQVLWKKIHELRVLGYDIASVPHLGYQLLSVPDRLFPSEVGRALGTRVIGRSIRYYDHVSSTMDTALRLARDNAPDGTVVVAEGQSKGRGRFGRSWVSPKYKGIYFSIILKPRTAISQAPAVTLMAAVCVCSALENVCGLDARIKWPNDIFIDERKLGGILTELQAENERIVSIIVGIGLNVNSDKRSPAEGAAVVSEFTRAHVNRASLLRGILEQFDEYYSVFKRNESGSILEAWKRYSLTLGRRVKIDSQKGRLEGVAVDIDADGGLILRLDSGFIEKITAGDVIHCR